MIWQNEDKSKKAIGVYLRVSSVGQDVKSQEPDLRAWLRAHGRDRPARWYRDTFTGRTMRRPSMAKLETDVVAGKIGCTPETLRTHGQD